MNGHQISMKRNTFNMSQDELAVLIGVSKYTISRWENNRNKPSRLAIKKINQVFSEKGDE